MKRFLGFWVGLGMAACLFAVGARAAAPAGDAEAKKTARSAMEKDYMAGDFELALQKLKLADSLCQTRGCTPAVRSQITASQAIVHWVGTEDRTAAVEELKTLVKADPKYKMSDEYASPELIAKLEAVKREANPTPAPPPAAPAPAAPAPAAPAPAAPAPAAPPPAAAPAPAKPDAPERDPETEEFRKKVDARKAQYAREAEEAQRAAAIADERRTAEEKLAEQERKVAEAKKLAEEKKEAAAKAAEERKAEQARRIEEAKKAEEDKKIAARKAAEDKKEAAKKAAEDAKKAAEEKKEAARKAVEEKKEADRKAAEEKKEAARKAIEDAKEAARKAAEEKKEAARKAAEDKREAAKKAAEDAVKKAEEARLAKEEQRMRTPVPVGKMQETLWREQTIGYPIPVFVKLPPPPQGIEKPRIEVVKVVTEYSSRNVAAPQQLELKPLVGGGYGGLLPCDASQQEGEVSYFTTALNKYDNPVARGGSADKPNKVQIKGTFTGSFPHLPGELPPKACEERGAKVARTSCTSDSECPDGVCTKEGCSAAGGNAGDAPPVANPTPRSGGCAGCTLGAHQTGAPAGVVAIAAACAVHIFRRRRRTPESAA